MTFADNLKQLPGVSHLAALQLIDAGDGKTRLEDRRLESHYARLASSAALPT